MDKTAIFEKYSHLLWYYYYSGHVCKIVHMEQAVKILQNYSTFNHYGRPM